MLRLRKPFSCLAIALALLACGCADAPAGGAGSSAAIVVVDDAGREVRLPHPARRVISLIPATTELVVELGAADRLVARTDYDEDPALAHLPSVGQGLTPNLEWLAARRPELVIAWRDGESRAVVARLGELGIPVYATRLEGLEDVVRTARHLGRLLGLEARADSLAAAAAAEFEAVRRAVAGRRRPRVFYVVWADPPVTAGPGTFVHEILEAAGAENIFADGPAGWPQVSVEAVLERQPEVLVIPRGEAWERPPEAVLGSPGWRDLEAVRRGRIVEVDAEVFHRPTRMVEAARHLAARLHPSAFPAGRTP